MLCFYSLFISPTPWVEKDGLSLPSARRTSGILELNKRVIVAGEMRDTKCLVCQLFLPSTPGQDCGE
jgi:hypothetical protein